jgi:hypothetical protein
MGIEPNIILNVLIAIVLYKMFINTVLIGFLKMVFNSDVGKDKTKEYRKTFKEKLEDLQNKQ